MAECHPVGLPLGDAGQARRRQGHPRRPAVHPHLGDGRHLRPAPRRQRHRLPRRPDPATSSRTNAVLPRLRGRLHQRRDAHHRGLQGHRGPRRPLLRLRRREPLLRREELAVRRRAARRAREPAEARPGRLAIVQRPGGPVDQAAPDRPDAARPALRLPDPPAALRPLYARDGREGLRDARRDVPGSRRDAGGGLGARPHGGDLLRGRLDAAHDRRADDPRRRRSCSCCSATSAGRAAASSRSAGTPRSRARPTSPRSTTSCPATSTCRAR